MIPHVVESYDTRIIYNLVRETTGLTAPPSHFVSRPNPTSVTSLSNSSPTSTDADETSSGLAVQIIRLLSSQPGARVEKDVGDKKRPTAGCKYLERSKLDKGLVNSTLEGTKHLLHDAHNRQRQNPSTARQE